MQLRLTRKILEFTIKVYNSYLSILKKLKKIASISLIIASLAAANVAHAGGGSSFAGGFTGGLASGLINNAINNATHPRSQTVIVEKRTVVVHDQSEQHHSSTKKKPAADPTPSPAATPVQVATPTATTMPTPIPVVVKPAPVVVKEDPTFAVTDPVKIDNPSDLSSKELALTQDKPAVLAFFEDYFKRTTPQNSLADSSLFMEVKIGAYNYLVAKITVNTMAGTLVKGFVIDLKNEYFAVLGLDDYHDFMHTGNINLLGERVLNPLD
jgi:hypothetical protein